MYDHPPPKKRLSLLTPFQISWGVFGGGVVVPATRGLEKHPGGPGGECFALKEPVQKCVNSQN